MNEIHTYTYTQNAHIYFCNTQYIYISAYVIVTLLKTKTTTTTKTTLHSEIFIRATKMFLLQSCKRPSPIKKMGHPEYDKNYI